MANKATKKKYPISWIGWYHWTAWVNASTIWSDFDQPKWARDTSMMDKMNRTMGKFQKKWEKKWAKFNKAGEMTSKPTEAMVKDFNTTFTTSKKPSTKAMEWRKSRLKK